jgi:Ca2+-binding RTX toxin-like protein
MAVNRTRKFLIALAGAAALVPAGSAAAAVSVSISGGDNGRTLFVRGTDGANDLKFESTGDCVESNFGPTCAKVTNNKGTIALPDGSNCRHEIGNDRVAFCGYDPDQHNRLDVKLFGGKDKFAVTYNAKHRNSWSVVADYGAGADTIDLDQYGVFAFDASTGIDNTQTTSLEILGGTGNDRFVGISNDWTNVRLRGQAGSDSFDVSTRLFTIPAAGSRESIVSGGNGNDTIALGTGGQGCGTPAELNGDAGDDTITGSACADHLNGGSGDDTLDGSNDSDVVRGGSGDDSLATFVDAAADTLDGGAGADTLRYSATGSVTIDLRNETQSTDGDRFFGLETLVTPGSSSAHVFGTAAAETFNLGDGQDTVDAGAGNDVIDVADSTSCANCTVDDHVQGGAGADTILADDGRKDDIACGSSSRRLGSAVFLDRDSTSLDSLDVANADCADATTVASQPRVPGRVTAGSPQGPERPSGRPERDPRGPQGPTPPGPDPAP